MHHVPTFINNDRPPRRGVCKNVRMTIGKWVQSMRANRHVDSLTFREIDKRNDQVMKANNEASFNERSRNFPDEGLTIFSRSNR